MYSLADFTFAIQPAKKNLLSDFLPGGQEFLVRAVLPVCLSFVCCCADSASGSGAAGLSELEKEVNSAKIPPSASTDLQSILQKEPHNARAHFLLALILERSGFVDLAGDEYEKAEQDDPGSALKVFAKKWQTSGPPAAWRFRDYISSHYAGDPSLLLMSAWAAARLNDTVSAEKFYQEACVRYVSAPGVRSAFASFRLGQRHFAEAIQLADYDLALKKDYAPALLTKAEALLNQGKFFPALPLIQKVYDSAVDRLDKLKAADLLAGYYERQGMYKAALEPTLVMLALSPEYNRDGLAAVERRVSVIVRSISFDLLVATVQLVRRQLKDPDYDFCLLYRLADVLDNNNKQALALSFFVEANRLKPNDGNLCYRLARLREINGETAESLRLLQCAVDGAPESKIINAGYQRLKSRLLNKSRDLSWKIKNLLKI